RRGSQVVKVSLWLGVVSATCGLHWYYAIAARAAADEVVRAVVAYKKRTGNYPEQLQDAGVDLGPRGGPWRIGYLMGETNSPALIYPTTFTVFEAYIYEFKDSRWIFAPD